MKEANRRAAPDPWDDLDVPEGLDLNWFTEELLAAARKGDGNPFEPGVLPPPEIVERVPCAGADSCRRRACCPSCRTWTAATTGS